MRSRNFHLTALLIAGSMVLTLGSGCGKRVGSLVDPAEEPTTPITSPTPEPVTPTPYPTTAPSLPGAPGAPTTPVTGAQLQAKIVSIKNGFLGMGTIRVEVQISNPTQYSLSGEVIVSFTDGGQPTTEVASERVSLMPNETITRYFENKKWSLDSATVTVKTDAPLATGYGTGYSNGYGSGYGYAY